MRAVAFLPSPKGRGILWRKPEKCRYSLSPWERGGVREGQINIDGISDTRNIFDSTGRV